MATSCENCSWFESKAKGLQYDYIIACGLKGAHPRNSDLLQAGLVDKDGACNFNPEPVRKKKTDVCGQHKPA